MPACDGSYSDSKLFVTTLAAAVARRWPDVLSNAVDPGWVPDEDGRRRARPTTCGSATSPRSGSPPATSRRRCTSGGYWHHQQRRDPHPSVHDERFQDELVEELAGLTDERLA